MTPNEMLSMIAQLRRERNEAREDLEFRRGLYKVQEQYLETARRERDEARGQNAKLRDIADALAVALERLDALYRSEQDPEAPMPRPDWLRRPLQMLDAELDQIKEGAK
jgi:hypothetical protein